MTKKAARGLVALVVLLFGAGRAQARDIVQNLQFDVFALGGGSTMVDPKYFTEAGRLFHSRFEVGPKFNIGLAVPYGKLLSFEMAYGNGPNNLVLSNQNIFPHAGVVYQERVSYGSVSALLHGPFTRFHFRPYGEAGIEFDRFTPTPDAIAYALNHGFGTVSTAIITHNDKAGLSIGGGLDRRISKRLTFRIDLRDHITGAPAFGLPPKPTFDTAAIFPNSGRANNIAYTAGIIIHLGKLR